MFKRIYFIIITFVLATVIYYFTNAFAEDITIKASVDKNKLSQDEAVTLKIEITGILKSSPEIKLPELKDDFEVVSSIQSQSISLSAKEKQQVAIFEYILSPKKSGKITIGEVEMQYDKKSYKTAPIEIEVSPSQTKPQPSIPKEEQEPIFKKGEGTII